MDIYFTFLKDKFKKNNFKKIDKFDIFLLKQKFINEENFEENKNFIIQNNQDILNSKAKNILVKGEVQSGKTNSIIYLVNEFIKEGIKNFIYLSGHLNILNDQNHERLKNAFKIINESVLFINAKSNAIDNSFINKANLKNKILFFYGIKKKDNFSFLLNNLSKKIIVIDDEADHFTLTKDFLNLREKFFNNNHDNIYISVTATPYRNLYHFKHLYNDFFVYKSHKRYHGLNSFFKNEKIIIEDSKNDEEILFKLAYYGFISKVNNFEIIWNVSRKILDHKKEADKIKQNLLNSRINIHKKLKNDKKRIEEWENTIFKIASNIQITNSKHKYIQKNIPTILIGRENLSRGLTYFNLVSAYYENIKEKYNPGVIMQSSRWFGTRNISNMKILVNKNLYFAYEECMRLEKITNDFKFDINYKDLVEKENFKFIEIKNEKTKN